MTKNVMKGLILGGLVAVAAGCANTDELRSEIAEVRSMAQDAQSTANAAKRTADSAQQTADRAMKAAQEAKSCCEANSKRIERMFEKSQRK